jgi:cytochrome c peroxidase
MDPPFGGMEGEAPRLNEQEIDDIVAFLDTLTDGWKSD